MDHFDDDIKDGQGGIPLTILTGFLGAGKTTLLNRILTGDHGLRVAVLVNDFGAINIDAELVVGVQDNVISLANGCVCCTIRDDLAQTVMQTINRPERPEYLLLEASGVADPGGIFLTFTHPNIRDRLRLDSVTCVVDADQVFAYADYPPLMQLKLRQIGFADMVILNKVDLAGREQVEQVKGWIDEHVNRIRIVETTYCQVPYEILMAVGRFDPARQLRASHEHDPDDEGADAAEHSALFSTWRYESDRPFSLDALKEVVRKDLPGSIYRCKGVIYTADEPRRRAVLQCVGRRTDVSLFDEWNDRKPRTRIVAIGALGVLDGKLLKEQFDACTQ